MTGRPTATQPAEKFASKPASQPDPGEADLRRRLSELLAELTDLPPAERQRLEKMAADSHERQDRLRQTVSGLQESLDHLRLSIKYLVFDLEATRRENQYLRRLLEETAGED